MRSCVRAAKSELRFLLDAYRRLIQMYGEVVEGIDPETFADELRRFEEAHGQHADSEDLTDLVDRFRGIYLGHTGADFPQDPRQQLLRAVGAVFESWNAPRACVYRAEYRISARSVRQRTSCRWCSATATPSRRQASASAAIRQPASPACSASSSSRLRAKTSWPGRALRSPSSGMLERMPAAYDELEAAVSLLERHYRDMQDVEFTVESGRLYILQTRGAKRTATAALRTAVDMVPRDCSRATRRSADRPLQLEQLLHPAIDPNRRPQRSRHGSLRLTRARPQGAPCSTPTRRPLVVLRARASCSSAPRRRPTTSMGFSRRWRPDRPRRDTSHAAVVARGLGKPCVAGCAELEIDLDARVARIGDAVIAEGDPLTIDGAPVGSSRVWRHSSSRSPMRTCRRSSSGPTKSGA